MTQRPRGPDSATRGSWRQYLLLGLPCLTCAGQLPVLLAVLAVTGSAGPLSFGIASAVLGAAFVALLLWGAKVLNAGEEGEKGRGTAMTKQRQLLGLVVLLAVVGIVGDAAAAPERVTLRIEGLTQTGCSSPASVKGTILRTEGVTQAEVSRERGEAIVEVDPAKADLAQLMAKVERYCLVKVTRPPAR